MKKFVPFIPKELLEKAEQKFKDNPPKIIAKDKKKQFIMQALVSKWWKEGGYKEIIKHL